MERNIYNCSSKNSMKKVFISYSWDNEQHKTWVLDLANDLRDNDVEVILDYSDLDTGSDFIRYMEAAIQNADYFIVILTPQYKAKAEERTGGVGYESNMIACEIFNNPSTKKILPILRTGDRKDSTPSFLMSRLSLDMSSDVNYNSNLSHLLRTIHQVPKEYHTRLHKKTIDQIESNKEILINNQLYSDIESKSNSTQKIERKIVVKVGRNESCPCGSGKKYKNCHGRIVNS